MRQEKTLLADEIKIHLDNYGPSFLITRYSKLSAEQASSFRTAIRDIGGKFMVVKKRILQKVADEKSLNFDDDFDGHIGVVFAGPDAIVTTKTVFDFSKNHENTVEVLAGHVDGAKYDSSQMEELSKLPSKDVMRAQLLATFEAPMAQTVAVMEALLTSVINCMENKCK